MSSVLLAQLQQLVIVHGYWVVGPAVNPVFGPLAKLTDEAFDKIMGANVKATIWFANLVCPGRRGCPAQGPA